MQPLDRQTNIQALEAALIAQDNCRNSEPMTQTAIEWEERWSHRIKHILNESPSGSGLDNGTKLIDWKPNRLVFQCDYHHMNEDGYYVAWTHHEVVVTPTFSGLDILVKGRGRNDIKDYIGEVIHNWLSDPAPSLQTA